MGFKKKGIISGRPVQARMRRVDARPLAILVGTDSCSEFSVWPSAQDLRHGAGVGERAAGAPTSGRRRVSRARGARGRAHGFGRERGKGTRLIAGAPPAPVPPGAAHLAIVVYEWRFKGC